jgi:hypothetical protein
LGALRNDNYTPEKNGLIMGSALAAKHAAKADPTLVIYHKKSGFQGENPVIDLIVKRCVYCFFMLTALSLR